MGGGGGGGGGGVVARWGHNNAFMCKLCPWQPEFMTILSFDLQVWPWTSTYINKCFERQFSFSKLVNFFLQRIQFGGGGGRWWTDEQAQTNLPLQLLPSWGPYKALMCKLCPWQAKFMTILSFDLQEGPCPLTYVNKCFERDFSSKTTTVQNYFEIHA